MTYNASWKLTAPQGYADRFINQRYLAQVNRAIHNLENRFGWAIERSPPSPNEQSAAYRLGSE